MGEIAIQVRNLSKRYRLGAQQARYRTIRESLVEAAKVPIRQIQSILSHSNNEIKNQKNTVWALKDISFDIRRGEAVGVIGRNGAGKSTLLKILSRITEPTTGSADVYGRVGSLLEVGTGFHPELTGRENIYLNGAILGMKRTEIERKFDEIVDFAEIEKFLDTPVKHYSSGMYLRLAFAVAAHLEPEILLVDEVLAVGDAQFQKKCLGKMGDVTKEGRTVLFVSHNMAAVQTLCEHGLWLDLGKIKGFGLMSEIVQKYLAEGFSNCTKVNWPLEIAPGNDQIKLISAEVKPVGGSNAHFLVREPIDLEFVFRKLTSNLYPLDFTFHLYDEMGVLVFVGSTAFEMEESQLESGYYRVACRIPENLLNDGSYTISRLLVVRDRGTIVYEHPNILSFEVINPGYETLGWMGSKKEGIVKPKLDWKVEKIRDIVE